MRTALQCALERAESLEAIPQMTDQLSRYWDQPDRREIEVDATHALMSRAAFDKLPDYSRSQPTGVYVGKMWKRAYYEEVDTRTQADVLEGARWYRIVGWWLCWFGPDPKPGYCSNNYRRILIADEPSQESGPAKTERKAA